MSDTEELKPCQRCGDNTGVIKCSGWGYSGHCSTSYCSGSGGWFSEWQDAADDWNTRPVEDALRNEIDSLNAIVIIRGQHEQKCIKLSMELEETKAQLAKAIDDNRVYEEGLLPSELVLHEQITFLQDGLDKAKAEIENLEDTQYQPIYRDGENPNE